MPVSSKDLETIITDPNGAETLVKKARELGSELKAKLTTSQIRALFGEVRQIQAQWSLGGDQRQLARRRLILLKPKMRYRTRKKEGSKAVEELVNVLEPALDLVIEAKDEKIQEQRFNHFVQFFEAILAYHQAYGGK